MSDFPSDPVSQPGTTDAAAHAHPRAPGAWLAAARQQHGLTVEQVASQLNLAPRQVSALEADDYAALPGMVIVRGFLRAYAKLLKVDPVPLLAMLADSSPSISTAPARQVSSSSFSQKPMPAMHSGLDRAIKAPVVALLAVVAVAAGASYALGWWPESLTRRFGQLRGAAMAGVGVTAGSTAAASVDANDGTRAADSGSATGSVTGVAARMASSTDGNAPGTDASAGRAAPAGEPGLTTTTVLSNPAAAVVPAGASSTSTKAGADGATGLSLAPATRVPVAPVAPVASPAGAPGAATSGKAAPGAAGAAGAAASNSVANPLVLRVQQDSWIEIKRANNTAMVSRLVKAGSVETFDIDQPVTLIVGNIAGVEASLRGAPLELASNAKGNVSKIRIE